MSIESALNVRKVSTFKVSNKFLENKCQNWVEIVTLSFSVTQYLCKNSNNMFIMMCAY